MADSQLRASMFLSENCEGFSACLDYYVNVGDACAHQPDRRQHVDPTPLNPLRLMRLLLQPR